MHTKHSLLRGQAYTALERRIFWECLKMETRYVVDIPLPESGLASLDLVTELFEMPFPLLIAVPRFLIAWTPIEKPFTRLYSICTSPNLMSNQCFCFMVRIRSS